MQKTNRNTLLKTAVPILVAAAILFCRTPVHAAPPDKNDVIAPVQTETIQSDNGETLLQRIYEVPLGTLPEDFVKDRFVENGIEYVLRNMEKRDLPPEKETKKVSQEVSHKSKSDDPDVATALFKDVLPFEEDGFEGELALDAGSMEIQPGESERYGYLVQSDTLTTGLPRNDPALIPKATVKDGVELQLVNIEWGRDENGIKAYAQYEGYASGTRVKEYTVTASYTGTVSRTGEQLSRYVATYGPVAPDTPAPVVSSGNTQKPTEKPQPQAAPKADNGSLSAVLIGIVTVMAAGGGIAGTLYFRKRKKKHAKPKIYMPRSMAPDKEELFDEQK